MSGLNWLKEEPIGGQSEPADGLLLHSLLFHWALHSGLFQLQAYKEDAQKCEERLSASSWRTVCLSVSLHLFLPVCPFSAWNRSTPTERIFIKFSHSGIFFEIMSIIFNFHHNLTGIAATLHVDLQLCTVDVSQNSYLESDIIQTKIVYNSRHKFYIQ